MFADTKPKTETELLERAQTLAGTTLASLAKKANLSLPSSFNRAKGFVGELIEWYLGADGFNLSKPDFAHLGIELKTLPLNERGEPQESTYVCTAPHSLSAAFETWQTSRVRLKLARVLWVPFEASKTIPIEARRIGTPLLWCLSSDMETILKQDWEELTEMLITGKINQLSARFGTYLHIRPKAAHSRVLSRTWDENSETILTGPKGFYLRTDFTKKILKECYAT